MTEDYVCQYVDCRNNVDQGSGKSLLSPAFWYNYKEISSTPLISQRFEEICHVLVMQRRNRLGKNSFIPTKMLSLNWSIWLHLVEISLNFRKVTEYSIELVCVYSRRQWETAQSCGKFVYRTQQSKLVSQWDRAQKSNCHTTSTLYNPNLDFFYPITNSPSPAVQISTFAWSVCIASTLLAHLTMWTGSNVSVVWRPWSWYALRVELSLFKATKVSEGFLNICVGDFLSKLALALQYTARSAF